MQFDAPQNLSRPGRALLASLKLLICFTLPTASKTGLRRIVVLKTQCRKRRIGWPKLRALCETRSAKAQSIDDGRLRNEAGQSCAIAMTSRDHHVHCPKGTATLTTRCRQRQRSRRASGTPTTALIFMPSIGIAQLVHSRPKFPKLILLSILVLSVNFPTAIFMV
jgi:hypothetical protein